MPQPLHRLRTGLLLAALLPAAAPAAPGTGFECLIKPSRDIQVGAPVPGVIARMAVDRGTPVKKGQLLATLDDRAERASLAIARHRADSDLELGLRRTALEIDRRIERRIAPLVKQDAASPQDLDRARREARLSAWRLKIAESEHRLRALEAARAEAAVALRAIRSPVDGVVAARLRHPGEHVDGDALLRVVTLDPLYVEAVLPMHLFGRVRPGMRARVVPEFAAFPSAEAQVEVVDPLGDAASGTFGIRLRLPNPERRIPAGLKCNLELLDWTPPSPDDRSAALQQP